MEPSAAFIFYVAAFCGGFLAFEGWVRFARPAGGIAGESVRKAGHAGAALLFALAPVVMSARELIAVCGIFAGLLALARVLKAVRATRTVKRITWGEMFFPLGVAASAALILPQSLIAYEAGILVLGLADSFAALAGKRFGTRPFPHRRSDKTIEGSGAFAIAAFAILYFLGAPLTLWLIAAAAVLALAEAVLPYGLDNLVIPVAAGALFLLLA